MVSFWPGRTGHWADDTAIVSTRPAWALNRPLPPPQTPRPVTGTLVIRRSKPELAAAWVAALRPRAATELLRGLSLGFVRLNESGRLWPAICAMRCMAARREP